ncbi:MAG: STELLO glycosyltransferase family protein [Pseudomonadota bacterium]|nr:STELLO glycosyltransferase family protein [Pseudomonadota bacterium]
MSTALVVTTIQAPNEVMQALAQACVASNSAFYIMGDRKSPPQYDLPGTSYFSLEDQHAHFGAFSKQLPVGHYVRKNLGYLAALDGGAQWIVETDDDNFPLPGFMTTPAPLRARRLKSATSWLNVYDHFAPSQSVWPRGYPLEALLPGQAPAISTHWVDESPLLVQGLADENPDVDAVYRLTRTLPVSFDRSAPPATLEIGSWCPFNSQNTWWHRSIFALMYLPSHCSFRMTDIWRSFVAQRCLWAMGHRVLFIAPTVRQERNEHNLLRDFADEVSGYLKNEQIRCTLDACTLTGVPEDDLLICYEALTAATIFPADELPLVRAWIDELKARRS